MQRRAIFAQPLEKPLAQRGGDPVLLGTTPNSREDRAMTFAYNLRGMAA